MTTRDGWEGRRVLRVLARGALAAMAVGAAAPLPDASPQTPLGEWTEPPAAAPVPAAPPSRRGGSWVARLVAPVQARRRLDARRGRVRLGVQSAWSGQPHRLLVLATARRRGREWVRVLLPIRPNGSAGWIARDKATYSRTPYWVDVDTSRRRVRVSRAGVVVRSFRAVVGAPGTPTPHGLTAIYERNRQPRPRGFLGPWALPLTILSNVLEDYGGGPGRVGIHGRDGASLRDPLGSARSHGCIRVANADVRWMAARLPVGTPVRIRR